MIKRFLLNWLFIIAGTATAIGLLVLVIFLLTVAPPIILNIVAFLAFTAFLSLLITISNYA